MDPGTVALSEWVRGRIPDLPISDHLTSGYVVIGRPTQFDSGRQGCPRAGHGLPFWETRLFLRQRQSKGLFPNLGAAR